MYPIDALTQYHELVGAGSYTMVAGTSVKYILGASIQQENVSSTSEVLCGSSVVARNYAKDLIHNNLQYRCEDDLKISKTGNDDASFIVTYVEKDLALTPTPATVRIDIASNSALAYGIHDSLFFMWTACALLIMIGAFFMGTYFFRK